MKKYMILYASIILILITGCSTTDTPPEVNDDNDIPECGEGFELNEAQDDCILIEEQPNRLTYNTYDYNGIEREYDLYLPDNLGENAPLVFVLHGYTSTSSMIRLYSDFNDVADEYGFAIVYPQGLRYNGITHWNAELEGTTVDDIGFLDALAKHLQTEHNLSTENTFMTGHSNGGFMSYTMACHNTGTFKAIASYAGLMSNTTWNTCSPTVPISILQIHGTDDNVVPNDGTMGPAGGFGGAPDVLTMLGFWTQYNNTTTLVETDISDIAHQYTYTGSDTSLVVQYIEIEGQNHNWPGDDDIMVDTDELSDTSQLIWEFFEELLK